MTILLYAGASKPRELYEKFEEKLCQDITKKQGLDKPDELVINECLLELQEMFSDNGKDMVKDFNLPAPNANLKKTAVPK